MIDLMRKWKFCVVDRYISQKKFWRGQRNWVRSCFYFILKHRAKSSISLREGHLRETVQNFVFLNESKEIEKDMFLIIPELCTNIIPPTYYAWEDYPTLN